MASKNRYAKHAKICEAKFRQFVKLFATDLDGVQIAELTGLNRNTIHRYLHAIRERIAEHCERQSPFAGEVEVDESYFGGKHKGKRGRGAAGKSIVFGILKRNGFVYTEIVPNVTRKTLQNIISGRVELNSVIHSDTFQSYEGLVDLGYLKHYRVRHGDREYVNEQSHINGIESFWGYAKTRLARFRGIHKSTFYLHLKECEFRFNNRMKNIYLLLLKIIREKPLF